MRINSLQFNTNTPTSFKNKRLNKSYLEANGTITTTNNIKPLPPKGHLIHDNFANSIKYFFKDIAYDFKSIKNGINGSANDHQLGRLNDIGLTTAGVLIATYLASKTTNPKARIMEYIGLGTFLTAMSIYPKLAINLPAKLVHGFDIDKEYIDDQGRKKSVMQDANYVPYDMYLGEIPEEDITIIGDKMGIPKDIKNRNDLIREQMRKISTQNNTLWMLTAGVTPALTALLCCGLENYVIAPAIEKARIATRDTNLSNILEKTTDMKTEISDIKHNSLSRSVEKLLKGYKTQELPKEEFENLINIFSEGLHNNTAQGIKEDLTKILTTSSETGSKLVVINNETADNILNTIKNSISKNNKKALADTLMPTKEEIEVVLKQFINAENNSINETVISADRVKEVKKALKTLLDSKIEQNTEIPKSFLNTVRNDILENVTKELKTQKTFMVTEEGLNEIVKFAKIIGEFKENQKVINKCREFNFEFTNETILARAYNKFEKTLLNVLDIKFSDLKKMSESDEYTQKILDKKLSELSKDEKRFEKAMKQLGDVIAEMEVKLNGNSEQKSKILDLINATENNYNKTAQRISKLGSFKSTIDRLVKQDVETLSNSLHNKQQLFDFLDGLLKNNFVGFDWGSASDAERLKYINEHSKGLGSSKNIEINRILERYQGAKNSFFRIMHTMDVYKRAQTPENFANSLNGKNAEYIKTIIQKAKEALLYASASDHTLKLDLINNPEFYKDLMYSVWAGESGEFFSTKQKGLITENTKNALQHNNNMAKGNLLDRFQYYITRFRNIVGNNNIDFTKPHSNLNPKVNQRYAMNERTRMAIFNLIGQTPVDMAKGAAGRKYATQKWARIIGGITGSVFGLAVLAQFSFGKLNNPQNVKKQVTNDSN